MKIYVLESDKWEWNQYNEFTVVARTEEEALNMIFNKYNKDQLPPRDAWKCREIDSSKPQTLTASLVEG